MNFDNTRIEVAYEAFEGPVFRPEPFLLKKWNKIFQRTGWCRICSEYKPFREKHGEKIGSDKILAAGLRLKGDVLDIIKKHWNLCLADNWSEFTNCVYANDESAIFFSIDRLDGNTVDISCFYHLDEGFTSSVAMTELLEYVNNSDVIIYPKDQPQIHLIKKLGSGFALGDFEFDDFEIDLDLNYGEDFLAEVHEPVLDFLEDENPRGNLVLFRGSPGTGKTYYLRHLVSETAQTVKAIFVPTYLVGALAEPEFIEFLRRLGKSVLIIEDAEAVLCSDGEKRDVAISNLLQLTEGLLKDCLKLKVIATFNTEEDNIDQAFHRKGRLAFYHDFRNLTIDEAKKKAESLGLDPDLIDKEMSLGDVYNLEYQNRSVPKKEKSRMGFA